MFNLMNQFDPWKLKSERKLKVLLKAKNHYLLVTSENLVAIQKQKRITSRCTSVAVLQSLIINNKFRFSTQNFHFTILAGLNAISSIIYKILPSGCCILGLYNISFPFIQTTSLGRMFTSHTISLCCMIPSSTP